MTLARRPGPTALVTAPMTALVTAALFACLAADAVPTAVPKRFLPADAIDVVALLPDPPAAGSAEARAELDAVVAIQQSRTPADAARAKAEEKFDVFAFADVVGPGFTADRCPRTAAVFKALAADAKAVAKAGKEHWDRRRPPFVDDRIHPVVTLEDEGSYPSSHSVRGQLYAEVLAAVLADRREPLLARGRQIGFDRLLGGVHYPSDVAAGRVLGHAIAGRLLADPAFRSRLADLKDELTTAGTAAAAK